MEEYHVNIRKLNEVHRGSLHIIFVAVLKILNMLKMKYVIMYFSKSIGVFLTHYIIGTSTVRLFYLHVLFTV